GAAASAVPVGYRMDHLDFSTVPQRLVLLVQDMSPRVLMLWYIYPLPSLSTVVALLLCAGLFIYWWRGNDGSPLMWDRLVTVLSVMVLLLCANILFLISSAFFLYRIFFVFGAMIGLLAFWSSEQIVRQSHLPALFGYRRCSSWIAITICSLGCIVAAVNNIQNALNSYLEFAFVKAQIAGAKP